MDTAHTEPLPTDAAQRAAIEESEKKASETHPENFKDEAMKDKQVEIPPVDGEEPPIHGLDNE